ncbi:MAG: hypothetical protein QGI75_07810 [Phycisphaerales bacterium]|jgi:hypothetical protein|nr:hypothetical protein [Phycisphaerales bacterium]MDP6891507.1 hypothetical protein [Phycisphaerales bacterium]
MSRNLSDQLLGTLKAAGVRPIFDTPGNTIHSTNPDQPRYGSAPSPEWHRRDCFFGALAAQAEAAAIGL